jgi:hypothetical protein
MNIDLDKQDLEKLSEILTIRDEQGRPMLKVGWVVRMFYADAFAKPVRETVCAIAEEYIQLMRDHLKWANHARTGHMHPIGSGRVKFPWEWIPQLDENEEDSWSFGYHGGEGDEDASSFSIRALGKETNRGPGYLEAYFPLAWFAEQDRRLQDFVLDWARHEAIDVPGSPTCRAVPWARCRVCDFRAYQHIAEPSSGHYGAHQRTELAHGALRSVREGARGPRLPQGATRGRVPHHPL